MNKWQRLFSRWGLIFFILILWEITPRLIAPELGYIMPPPSEIFLLSISVLSGAAIYSDIAISLYRIFLGFGLAAIVGISFGLLMGKYFLIQNMFDPLIEIVRPLSPIALFPLFILFFGIGLTSKVAIIFWICLFPIILNTVKGVKSVDPILLDAAKSMNASESKIFLSVIFPNSLFWITTGLRISFSSAFVALIAAEMIGSSSGIGFYVLYSARTFKITEMYLGIIIIGILGFLFNYLFIKVEERFSHWRSID